MTLSSGELDSLTLMLAKELFGRNVFRRRRLMLAVEARVKELNAWTAEDDVLSASAGTKSKGLCEYRLVNNPPRRPWLPETRAGSVGNFKLAQ
jgi:hypothetical protein